MVKNESAQRSTSYSDSSHAGTTVTWRSIFIAFLLIPPNVFWVVETECIWHSGHPTTISLFWNVVLNLFFLILINLGIKQVSPKSALSQAEFITIYVMLSIASGLAGHDTLALTIPALPHAFWFLTSRKYMCPSYANSICDVFACRRVVSQVSRSSQNLGAKF